MRLTPQEKVRLHRYRTDLHSIVNKKTAVAQKRRILEQKGGFLPALPAPLASSVLLPLLRQLFARMANVKKMALVDPRLLETLQNLDADMTSILDRTDIEVSDKVGLYNQALLRYNGMTKTRANKPTWVVVVREEKTVNAEDADEENDCAGEIVATMPKLLNMKARVLTARLKKMVNWNDRGELLHEGVAIRGSNITDLVHDLVRRPKTFDPIGWRQPASQLRSSNIPIELVGNVARRQHIQKGEITPQKKQATSRKKRTVSRQNTPALVLDGWESS